MELIEIRNNLVKLSYGEDEKPILGHFIALTGEDKSYVAQFVNFKADNINNFAVAKLMFSFNSDGVVIDYDGSAPSIKSNIVPLPVNELLDLLPIDTPIRIGQIAGSTDFFNVDVSIFEHNFTVFCDSNIEKTMFISNCVRQLFRMKEKSVIIDSDSLFDEYPKIVLGENFKLPLNSDLIDFIFDYELTEVDAPTKAVIQDIFYAVQQYIKTLEDEFIPIESFIDVIAAQYKETQMPELALLKNKLLKYSNAGIFANEASDFKILEENLKEHNCNVINIKDFAPELQKEIISYLHKIIEKFDKYVYYFVPVTDENSDKKLLRQLINHNHVFTTFISGHNYKYASELKTQAQNIMFFAPQTLQNDFAAYNTFLNKLNPTEGVIYGKLTQGIPLIITIDDMDLDLTKDDVFGDKQKFIPAIEDDILSNDDIYAINNLQESPELYVESSNIDSSANYVENEIPQDQSEQISDNNLVSDESYENTYSDDSEEDTFQNENTEINSEEVPEYNETSHSNNFIEPIENIMADDDKSDNAPSVTEDSIQQEIEYHHEENIKEDNIEQEENNIDEHEEYNSNEAKDENELSFMNDFVTDEESFEDEVSVSEELDDELTEDDLDFIDSGNQTLSKTEETTPVVPIYNVEEEFKDGENYDFSAGDRIVNSRFGQGTIKGIKKYGNKTLCSIDFDNIGRRLLDPTVSDLEKIG